MAGIAHHTAGAPGGGPSTPHPPLDPCSAEDVASFAALDHSLRSHPELAKEGPAVLNPEALAKLVDGIRTFQDEHLGRNSKSRRWPLVRLPDHIFRDRSRTGPLYAALISAYRTKSQSSWRNFDMGSNRRFDDNVSLMRRMVDDLIAAGFLRRPAIHLDDTVPKSRRGGMARIIERFGGKMVSDPADATHVVAHDPAIDGDPSADADWTHGSAAFADDGEDDPEKEYVRTIAVVEDPANGQKMTLAHWWFFPASYDVWMPSKEVAGDAAAEPRQAGPASEDGKWVVASRFVRDVARFNEWGNEADYAIADYHAKVALYKGSRTEPIKSKKKSSSLTGGKKGSKSKSSDLASISSDFSAGPASVSSKAGESDRKRDRRAGSGMNPRPILTGFYSESGSRLRRIVHDGALRVPPRSVGIVRDSLDLVAAGWDEKERRKWEASGGSKGKRRVFELPSVDSVARPSLDASLGSTLLVTELFAGAGGETIARNRCVPVLPNPDDDDGGAERIRGGGDDEDCGVSDPSAVVLSDPGGANSGVGGAISESAPADSDALPAENMANISNTTLDDIDMAGPGSTEIVTPHEVPAQPRIVTLAGNSSSTGGDLNVLSSSHDKPTETSAVEQSSSQTPAMATVDETHSASETPSAGPADHASEATSTTAASTQIPGLQLPSQPASVPVPASAMETKPVVPGNEMSAATVAEEGSEARIAAAPGISAAAATAPETAKTPSTTTATDQSTGSGSSPQAQQPSAPSTSAAPAVSASVREGSDTAREVNETLSPPSSASAVPVPPASVSSGSVKTASTAVSSPRSAPTPIPSSTTEPPPVMALPDRPAQQQASAPPAEAEDSPTNDSSAPSWYDSKSVSDIERTLLPEWFDSSASHRTPDSYIDTRERVVSIGRRSQGRYITATAVRRVVPGDAGSLLRLHSFLVQWGFLNGDALGDSAPTMPGLRKDGEKAPEKPPRPRLPDGKFAWTGKLRKALAMAVVKFATKHQKTGESTSPAGSRVAVDWAAVAAEVGNGATPADCQGEFLSLSLDNTEDDISINEDGSSEYGNEDLAEGRKRRRLVVGRRDVLNELLDGVHPNVIAEATNAALIAAGGNTSEAQKAAVLGVIGAQAMEEAKAEEAAIERILMEILDQRMMRLENRVALLDDMEGMLEAERVALELERRDLYTARCRHWFGGGN